MRHGDCGRRLRVAFLSTAANPPLQWRPPIDILPLCSGAQPLHQIQQFRHTPVLPFTFLVQHYHPCLHYSNGSHRDNSLCDDGLGFYNKLLRDAHFKPDDYTFPFVLKLGADFLRVSKGLEVHGKLIKAGLDLDVFVNNTLMLFYGSCGDLRSVNKVFDEMPDRNLVSWNTGMRVFSDNGQWLESLGLFKDMISTGGLLPNVITVLSLLSVCAGLEDFRLVNLIHCNFFKVGLDGEVKIGNALVDVYGKYGNMEASEEVFHEMVDRNEVSWNSIIGSFSYMGYNANALSYFRLMISEQVRLNTVTIATVLPTFVELNLLNNGREIHSYSLKMDMDTDVFVANTLIDMYGKLNRFFEASNVFRNMGC